MATGLVDRVLHARALDDVESDDLFTRRSERSGLVDHPAVSHPHRHRRRWRRQWLTLKQDVARSNIGQPGVDGTSYLTGSGRNGRISTDEVEELHGSPIPRSFRRTLGHTLRATTRRINGDERVDSLGLCPIVTVLCLALTTVPKCW